MNNRGISFYVLLFILINIGLCQNAIAGKDNYSFDDDARAELDSLCQQIIKNFPPKEYFYICIGQCSTPIELCLSCKYQHPSVQIPLSEFKLYTYILNKKNRTRMPKEEPSFPSDKAKENLFLYFDNFFKEEVIRDEEKKWLVISIAMTGNTLLSSRFALNSYLKQKKIEKTIEMLAIIESFGTVDSDRNQKPEEPEEMAYLQMNMHVAHAVHVNEATPGICDFIKTSSLESQLLHGECNSMAPPQKKWQDIIKGNFEQETPESTTPQDYLKSQVLSYVFGGKTNIKWRVWTVKTSPPLSQK